MRRAPGVLFGVFGVCLGPKLVLFMRKEECEIIEIASIHAVFMHVAENIVG